MPTNSKEKQRQYSQTWYNKNKKLQRERNDVIRQRNKAWLDEYKSTLKCERCPESNPVCLDFHHTKDKEKQISEAIRYGWSIARIQKEIAKCIVLCSNCHRKEHHATVV